MKIKLLLAGIALCVWLLGTTWDVRKVGMIGGQDNAKAVQRQNTLRETGYEPFAASTGGQDETIYWRRRIWEWTQVRDRIMMLWQPLPIDADE